MMDQETHSNQLDKTFFAKESHRLPFQFHWPQVYLQSSDQSQEPTLEILPFSSKEQIQTISMPQTSKSTQKDVKVVELLALKQNIKTMMRRLRIISQTFLARTIKPIFLKGLSFESDQENGENIQMSHVILIDIPDQEIRSAQELTQYIELVRRNQLGRSMDNKTKFLKISSTLKNLMREVDKKLTECRGQEHICKICNLQFENGRKLGGHMSRKHPGSSLQYNIRKNVQKSKAAEKSRRNFFKKVKKEIQQTK